MPKVHPRAARFALFSASGLAALTLLATPASTQQTSGPIERYDMRAGTLSGMAGMGAGMGSALGMMMGRGGGAQHELELRLGSAQAPAKGAAKAEHFMPPGAKLGKSVLLAPPEKAEPVDGDMPYQKPKGRLLIYWGCGATAPKGQPIIIDFAKVAAGQMPPGLYAGAPIIDRGPNAGNSRSFVRWPAKDGKSAKPDSMLTGAHRISSNIGPEISFTAARDFMAPLTARSQSLPGGATTISWGGIGGATGYYAWAFGATLGQDGQPRDMVWWSSSSSRAFGGGLADWLSPAQVATLVKSKQVMPSTQTSCTMPAEVKKAAPDMLMGMLYAYGPEENFAYPPRPADPKALWKIDWTARIRHRSMTMWMIGAPAGMPAGMGEQDGAEGQAPKKKCKGGLGGMLGGMMGAGSGC